MKFSQRKSAVRNRIKNLPQIFEKSIRSKYKKEALKVARTFEELIEGRRGRLAPLQPETIRRKRKRGMRKPSTELYGTGDYSKMMKVVLKGKKWVVMPKEGMHHSGLLYKDILDVHENGRTISRTSSKGKQFIIRIKPRPARAKAFNLYLRRRKKDDINADIWKGISSLIRGNKIAE